MMGRNSFLTILIIILIFQTTLTQTHADQWDDVLAANKITIGMDTTYEPFQWIKNSKVVGYEVDLSARIGELLGVNVEIISTPWVTIIPDLQSAKFDIIMSAMTITPTRQTQIDFTTPYFYDSLGILVQSGNSFDIKIVNDANKTSIKVGSISGTSADLWVSTNLINATKVSFASDILVYQAFNNRDIDVLVNSWYTIGHEIKKGNLNGEIIDWGFDQYGPLGIGVRKGEARLLSMLNNVVATMFFDGTYINITESWFAVTGLNVAIDPSVETKTEIQTDFTTSTETRTETRTETDHTTSTIRTTDKSVVTTYDVITSTFIDSKAEVTYNLAIPSIIFSIVLYTYALFKNYHHLQFS